MAYIAILLTLGSFLFYCTAQVLALLRNIDHAKASGLKYQYAPMRILIISFLGGWLPNHIIESIIPLIGFPRCWQDSYSVFAHAGDTFLMLSFTKPLLWTCEPEAIRQILPRSSILRAPAMKVLNVFGPTLPAADGEEAKAYRRITARAFTEESCHSIFAESVKQVDEFMIDLFTSNVSGIEKELDEKTGRITLHVIARILYGKKLSWRSAEHEEPGQSESVVFTETIIAMVRNLRTFFMTPGFIRNISPLRNHRRAKKAFQGWSKTMESMIALESSELLRRGPIKNPNILEALVQAEHNGRISPAAVRGNLLLFLMAGHETSANALHFAITALACHPDIQKELQSSLDKLYANTAPSMWSYKEHFVALERSYTSAVVHEILRLYPSLPFFLRKIGPVGESIQLNNLSHTIPPDTTVFVNVSAVHQHPMIWDSNSPSPNEHKPYPFSSFNPSQWLETDGKVSTRPDGAYIPFSIGPRGCLGYKLAFVELCAIIARIFKEYSVELVTVEKEGMSEQARATAWQDALMVTEERMSAGVWFDIGLKMKSVPIKFIRRERNIE